MRSLSSGASAHKPQVVHEKHPPQTLDSFLDGLQLGQYAITLRSHGFDTVPSLLTATDDDLVSMGMKLLGHRRVLVSAARAQCRNTPSADDLIQHSHAERVAEEWHQKRKNADWQQSEDFWEKARSRTPRDNPRVGARRVVHRTWPETILLVRHGQSTANLDHSVYQTTADHAIPLSEKGIEQAKAAGRAVAEFHRKKHGGRSAPPADWVCRAWVSPYARARQTAEIMTEYSDGWITDHRESIHLVEQQFGLFEGFEWSLESKELRNEESKELRNEYRSELAYYEKACSFGGRFWAKVPLGESRFDVAMRVHQCFGSIHRDAEFLGITNHVVVSHGLTLRAFCMMWTHQTPEWLEVEPNFQNGAVRLLTPEKGDCGYIHGGPVTERTEPYFRYTF